MGHRNWGSERDAPRADTASCCPVGDAGARVLPVLLGEAVSLPPSGGEAVAGHGISAGGRTPVLLLAVPMHLARLSSRSEGSVGARNQTWATGFLPRRGDYLTAVEDWFNVRLNERSSMSIFYTHRMVSSAMSFPSSRRECSTPSTCQPLQHELEEPLAWFAPPLLTWSPVT